MKIFSFFGLAALLTLLFCYVVSVLWVFGALFVAFCIWGDPGAPDPVTIRTIGALIFIFAIFCSAAAHRED